jgi:hypothetical protein
MHDKTDRQRARERKREREREGERERERESERQREREREREREVSLVQSAFYSSSLCEAVRPPTDKARLYGVGVYKAKG